MIFIPLLLSGTLAFGATAHIVLDPTEIVNRANKALRGDSSRVSMEMTVRTPNWTRSLDIEAWSKGRDQALIVIHSPPKDRGNTTLRKRNEMWLWLPKVERTMKIPPTMMHTSWQGSDFTYEDIVKADSIVKDYTHVVTERTPKDGYEVVKIEATPKPDAPVVWGKVLFWANVYPDEGVVPVREEDYSERGERMRTIELSDIKMVQGLRVPMRLDCVPERKPGQKTSIQYHSIDFNITLPDGFFGLSRLQRSGG